MKVIGLCGKTGSGKDAAANYVVAKHEGCMFKHSDRLRDLLVHNDLPVVPERMSALFEAVASQLGYQWLAAEVTGEINRRFVNHFPNIFVINGIRNVKEVEFYRRCFGEDFRLVSLHAPQEMRYARVKNRGSRKNEHDMSWEQFLAIESLESHTGEEAVMALADNRVDNQYLIDHLHAKLDQLFRP